MDDESMIHADLWSKHIYCRDAWSLGRTRSSLFVKSSGADACVVLSF